MNFLLMTFSHLFSSILKAHLSHLKVGWDMESKHQVLPLLHLPPNSSQFQSTNSLLHRH